MPKSGVTRWVVDYTDRQGVRRMPQFQLKRDADAALTRIKSELSAGTHTPTSVARTVKEAAERWYADGVRTNERATQRNYRHFLDSYILPMLGRTKLGALTKPGVVVFRDHLLDQGKTALTVTKVLLVLKGVLKAAEERGWVAQNPAAGVTVKKNKRVKNGDLNGDRDDDEEPSQGPLKVGRDIPTKEEVKALIDAASEGKWRTLLIVLAFCGLRASEARGLTWSDKEGLPLVDLDKRNLNIQQRADRFNEMGVPKSKAGTRDIPLSPMVTNTLKAWRLKLPTGKSNLVFPSQADTPLWHSGIVNGWWRPLQRSAGVVDSKGNPKYKLHSLRHFAASHWIELGFQPKEVQSMMGHASIVITLDTYSHLFPKPEANQERLARGDLFLSG
jgi:integrase